MTSSQAGSSHDANAIELRSIARSANAQGAHTNYHTMLSRKSGNMQNARNNDGVASNEEGLQGNTIANIVQSSELEGISNLPSGQLGEQGRALLPPNTMLEPTPAGTSPREGPGIQPWSSASGSSTPLLGDFIGQDGAFIMPMDSSGTPQSDYAQGAAQLLDLGPNSNERRSPADVSSIVSSQHPRSVVSTNSLGIRKIHARKREIENLLRANEFSIEDLLRMEEKEVTENIQKLDLELADAQMTDPALFNEHLYELQNAYHIELEELAHLRIAYVNDPLLGEAVGYRHTCPELQNLICNPDTYVQTRKSLLEWGAGDQSSHGIHWLVGDKGMGKTCLCRSLALEFEERGQLAASYFLHGRNDRISLLPRAIIHGLAEVDSHYSIPVKDADSATEITEIINKQQFMLEERLLAKPWQGPPRLLVIVDGIDRCPNEQEISTLVSIISTFSSLAIPFAWLLSGCYVGDTAQILSKLKETKHANFVIDLNANPEADANIRHYARAKINELTQAINDEELTTEVIEFLVKGAEGQFSFVDALLKEISAVQDLSTLSREQFWSLISARPSVYRSLDEEFMSLLDEASDRPSSLTLYVDDTSSHNSRYPADPKQIIRDSPLQVILYHLLYLDQIPSLGPNISRFWGIPRSHVLQLTKRLYPVLRVPSDLQDMVPLEMKLGPFRTFLMTPERSGIYAINRTAFDWVAAAQSIDLVNSTRLDSHSPSFVTRGMYTAWLTIAQAADSNSWDNSWDNNSDSYYRLNAVLEHVDPESWVNEGLALLEGRFGLFFKLRATLRVAKNCFDQRVPLETIL
ncbi:hypothetical protein AX16_004601 [Volvariella volvacea WC 439]|nr:hypothetical protein AX16_004601 [Volvariella volvacea WC 439]